MQALDIHENRLATSFSRLVAFGGVCRRSFFFDETGILDNVWNHIPVVKKRTPTESSLLKRNFITA